ncbi:MAG: DoxX family protein [bacterium]
MKNQKVIFWVSTSLIFLFEGVIQVLTYGSPDSVKMMMHLGYPAYFTPFLTVMKVLGALAIIVPQVPARVKEWAYAGISFTLIGALVSNVAVDGLQIGMVVFVGVVFAILAASYSSYHKIHHLK